VRDGHVSTSPKDARANNKSNSKNGGSSSNNDSKSGSPAAAAVGLRQLARAGARKQILSSFRDIAGLFVVAIVIFRALSKPLGLVLGLVALLVFAAFALMVGTSGARLQKQLRDPTQVRAVVIANKTKRPALARAWIIGSANRSVTVPFLAADIDVAVEALRRSAPTRTLKRFDTEQEARADAANIAKGS
jgi:hypothetical protein